MTVLERIDASRLLDEAGVPGGTLVERVKWLIERDARRLDLLIESTLQRQHLRDRVTMLEAERSAFVARGEM